MDNSGISNSNFEKLCQEIRNGNVILWIGAGFSAYAGYLTGDPLCSHLKSIITQEFEENITSNSLLEVASLFIRKKGRKLLEDELIRIYGSVPKNFLIHEQLSRINYFPIIITTNYDTLIEQTYGERIYTITDDRFFPKIPKEQDNLILLKIHGDITCPSKMVISSEDYNSYDEDSILWAKLKTICSEYSILFLGYSLSDSNVSALLDYIFQRLGNNKNLYYLISRLISHEKNVSLSKSRIIGIEMTNEEAITKIYQTVTRNSMLRMLKNPSDISKIHPILNKSGAQVHYTMRDRSCDYLSIGPEKNNPQIEIGGKIRLKGQNNQIMDRFISCINRETVNPIKLSKDFFDIEFSANFKDLNLINTKNDAEFKLEEITFIPQPDSTGIIDISVDSLPYRLNCSYRYFVGKNEEKLEIIHQLFSITFDYQKKRDATANISICPPSSVYIGYTILTIFTKWIKGEQLRIIPTESAHTGSILSPTIVSEEFLRNISYLERLYSYLNLIEQKKHIKIDIPDTIKTKELELISVIHAILSKREVILEDLSLDLEENYDYSTLLRITELKKAERLSIPINLTIILFSTSFSMEFLLIIGRDDLQDQQKIIKYIKSKKRIDKLVFKNKSGHLCLQPTEAPY